MIAEGLVWASVYLAKNARRTKQGKSIQNSALASILTKVFYQAPVHESCHGPVRGLLFRPGELRASRSQCWMLSDVVKSNVGAILHSVGRITLPRPPGVIHNFYAIYA